MSVDDYDEDEEKAMLSAQGGKRYEFHCTACEANNPWADGFVKGDDICCFYCGVNFTVLQTEGKLRIKEH